METHLTILIAATDDQSGLLFTHASALLRKETVMSS